MSRTGSGSDRPVSHDQPCGSGSSGGDTVLVHSNGNFQYVCPITPRNLVGERQRRLRSGRDEPHGLGRALRSESRPDPIQRTKTSSVVVDQEGPVGLEHEESNSFGQPRRQTAGIENLAASDEQTHGSRTVLSVSDDPERCAVSTVKPSWFVRTWETARRCD
jgi:hypothetical protein